MMRNAVSFWEEVVRGIRPALRQQLESKRLRFMLVLRLVVLTLFHRFRLPGFEKPGGAPVEVQTPRRRPHSQAVGLDLLVASR